MKPNSTGKIYMDLSTIEHGKECSDCLRWFVPVRSDDECIHCKQHGCPENPNRVRYLAIKGEISLRELARQAELSWRAMRLISQGKVAPRRKTERKILRAMGMSTRKDERKYVFPFSRYL